MSQRCWISRVAALVLSAALPACDEGDSPPEGEAVAGGKADGLFGIEEDTPEALAILALANEADRATLDDEVGLDRRAADGIVAARAQAGADGLAGFQSLAELDAIKFVGRSAFERMAAHVADQDLIGRDLKVSTFNIRWFGLDGDLHGSLGTESRVDTVRAFLEAEMADRDVLVFQEIVDLDLFTTEVVPDLDCITYEGFSGKHQHVMVCTSEGYRLVPAADDDDFALEALNTGSLRPGVHGQLLTASGTPVAHLVAVHLKANELSTDRRLAQAGILFEHVEALRARSGLPVITIGDFNTHLAVHTGRAEDDESMIDDVLAPLRRVPLPVTFTYQEKDGTRFRLDQAWLSPDIEVVDVRSPGACDLDLTTHADAIAEHFDTLSDHCPLILDLRL